MILKTDMRKHSAAVERRPIRSSTRAIVVHHLGVDIAPRDGVTTIGESVYFFTKTAEGISTVAMSGSYASHVDWIKRMNAKGPPFITDDGRNVTAAGFVPYHFVIDRVGEVYRMLDLAAKGAHAGNAKRDWNEISVGVAFLGDFSRAAPTSPELVAGVALLEDILSVHRHAEILSHDETLLRDGLEPKGCPGKYFPLDEIRRLVRRPAPR